MYICLCMYTYIYVYINICIYMYVSMYINVCIYMCVKIYIYIYMDMCVITSSNRQQTQTNGTRIIGLNKECKRAEAGGHLRHVRIPIDLGICSQPQEDTCEWHTRVGVLCGYGWVVAYECKGVFSISSFPCNMIFSMIVRYRMMQNQKRNNSCDDEVVDKQSTSL